jgi:hypothetical protein
MKRPLYSALAALAVSATMVGSAFAAQGSSEPVDSSRAATQVAAAESAVAAPMPSAVHDFVRGGAAEVHITKRSMIPDGWWKDE